MEIKYVIHFKHGFANCFSYSDLLTNLRFAFREGYPILKVEAV